ncbi:hypothetical protein MTR55_12235, partial [Escherichia coli]|nr:hypothetical protein [Escherichia coli]
IICSPMTSLKTSIKTITYLSDTGCLEIQGASLLIALNIVRNEMNKYQKSLNMPVWVDICIAGCDNRASFALFLIISRVKR